MSTFLRSYFLNCSMWKHTANNGNGVFFFLESVCVTVTTLYHDWYFKCGGGSV